MRRPHRHRPNWHDGRRLWLYYAAGAVFSGSAAGFYWTVMSSTTAGTVYTNTYVPGTSSFDIPASPTAVVDAGPGAFTGVTSEITAISITVPGGAMGINGTLSSEYAWSCNNSAGNKTCSSKLAGTTFSTFSGTTSTFARYLGRLQNKGVQNRNFYNQYQTYGVTNSSNWSSIDTSAAQTFTQTITRTRLDRWQSCRGLHRRRHPAPAACRGGDLHRERSGGAAQVRRQDGR